MKILAGIFFFFLGLVFAQIDPGGYLSESLNGRTLTIHPDRKVASMQISQSEFDKWNSGCPNGYCSNTDVNAMSNAIYSFFRDDFDFITFISNNASKPAAINYSGQLVSVQNDISGLGQNIYDATADVGSAGKLQSFIHLPYLTAMQNGPTLHEVVHRWANFIQDFEMASPNANYAAKPHWGWTGIPGQLGGFDPATLVNLGGNNWQANNGKPGSVSFDGTANGGNGLPYATWELYLMGLLSVDSLTDITYFTNVVTDQTLYAQGKFSGTQNTYSVSAFLAEHGARSPDLNSSQKSFRMLCIVLTPAPLTTDEWTTISGQVDWFTKVGDDGIPSFYNFWEATLGLAQMDGGGLYQSLLSVDTPVALNVAKNKNFGILQRIGKRSWHLSRGVKVIDLFTSNGRSVGAVPVVERGEGKVLDLGAYAPGLYYLKTTVGVNKILIP